MIRFVKMLITECQLVEISHIDRNVTEIVIPASLSKVNNLEKIFLLLKVNSSIKRALICDDYLDPSDDETRYFCSRIKDELSNVEVVWIRELKIDGRHGR